MGTLTGPEVSRAGEELRVNATPIVRCRSPIILHLSQRGGLAVFALVLIAPRLSLAREVPFPSSATLIWGPPACMGGAPGVLLYRTIRSQNPSSFVTGAVCVETNGPDTTSVDPGSPPPGQIYFYVVSPVNGCLSGPACLDPACVQPPARDCWRRWGVARDSTARGECDV